MSDATSRFKMNMDPRVTKVGALLRRFSIDELHSCSTSSRQYVARRPATFPVDQSEALYLDPASPGSKCPWHDGLWQVSGRSDLVWDDLCRLDSVYVRSWSLLWDLRILAQTPAAVFRVAAPTSEGSRRRPAARGDVEGEPMVGSSDDPGARWCLLYRHHHAVRRRARSDGQTLVSSHWPSFRPTVTITAAVAESAPEASSSHQLRFVIQ